MTMNRKLLVAVGLVFLFVVVVLVWYFVYAKPEAAPTLSGTGDPLLRNELPPRFQFIGVGGEEDGGSYTEVTQEPEDPLVRVWDKPATGQFFMVDEILKEETATTTQGTSTIEVKRTVRATTTLLLFVDRETGYIYGYAPENNIVFQVTNTIVSGVRDAYIFADGRRVIMRYADEEGHSIIGIIATIPRFSQGGTASPLEDMEYLNGELSSVAVSKNGKTAAYVVKTDTGSSVYSISTGESTLMGSSPFGEWVLSFGGDTLYATTKPSAYATGITTTLPTFAVYLGERAGLMVEAGDGVLAGSSWVQGGVSTFLVQNGAITPLATKTLASKCGWGERFLVCGTPGSLFVSGKHLPDAWLQGFISFVDKLVVIDKESGEEKTLFSFDEKYGIFDVTKIKISPDDTLVSFINKKNGELWVLKRNLLPLE